jgi:hypothetical protein
MKMLLAGERKGGDKKVLSPEERFLIAFQADGAFQPGKYRNGNLCGYIQVNFSFDKNRKKIRLREILNLCNFSYKESGCKRNPNRTVFRVKVNPQFPKKRFEEWVNLQDKNISWCKDFIDEIAEWDGHKVSESHGNRITYGSVIKSNVDIVQAIALLCNYRTHLTVRPDKRKITFSDYHRLQIVKNKNSVRGSCIKKVLVDYNDYVYGVQVPSTFIVTRNNGAVVITGNSLHVEFGIQLIKEIIKEHPELWSKKFKDEIVSWIIKATNLEIDFAKEMLPNGVLGLNHDNIIQYMKYLGNLRCEQLELQPPFEKVENCFGWMGETIETGKLKNFFESRVTDYRKGAVIDDL